MDHQHQQQNMIKKIKRTSSSYYIYIDLSDWFLLTLCKQAQAARGSRWTNQVALQKVLDWKGMERGRMGYLPPGCFTPVHGCPSMATDEGRDFVATNLLYALATLRMYIVYINLSGWLFVSKIFEVSMYCILLT